MKKPAWAVARDKARRADAARTVWLFGLHAVRDALDNPRRERVRLIVTKNAADRLAEAIAASGMEPEIADARRFPAPLDPGSVHQGAALEARPLDWGRLEDVCADAGGADATALGQASEGQGSGGIDLSSADTTVRRPPCVVLLDRVTDPHNVGAILRSAEVFGARAVIAPARHAAPETGALAKSASGALERQPYLRVGNLGDAMLQLRRMGYALIGLDGEAGHSVAEAAAAVPGPIGLVLGAEGPGLRARTRETCDSLARIEAAGGFGSLNVSNAAAVALYAVQTREI